jgi:hypothetical protein
MALIDELQDFIPLQSWSFIWFVLRQLVAVADFLASAQGGLLQIHFAFGGLGVSNDLRIDKVKSIWRFGGGLPGATLAVFTATTEFGCNPGKGYAC